MAFEIIRRDTQTKKEIVAILDSVSDLTDLGTDFATGSVAKIAGGDVYVLNASKTWVKE